MIQLSYNGTLYSYDRITTAVITPLANVQILIHPYTSIEGASLFYSQGNVEGVVEITNNSAEIPGEYLLTGDLEVALKLSNGTISNLFKLGITKVGSSGEIYDDDAQFILDNNKRLILIPGQQNILAIQMDNNSEVITFKFPRYQEGIDLSSKTPYVNYKRPKASDLGKSLCTIEKTTDDSIYFSWTIDVTATQYEGTIQFQVEFTDFDTYRWQSQIGELPILPSLYNTGLEPYDPGILEEYLELIHDMYTAYHMPEGGSTNQVLKKLSDQDFDVGWEDESGGGTSDYDDLTNKPQVNGVTLSGNKSTSDLKLDQMYWATYGTTTGLNLATLGNKVVACKYNSVIYYLAQITSQTVITTDGNATETEYLFTAPISGASVKWVKLIHTIYQDLTVPETNVWSNGTSSVSVPSAATATPSDLGTAAVGSSSKYAKEDHVHAKPSAADLGITVPEAATATPKNPGTAAVGTSTKYAREDHVHKQQVVPVVGSSNPEPLGTASPGVSLNYSAADHVHAMPTAANVGAIAAPSSPSVGDFLVYTSNGWAAQSLSTWQGGSY